MEPVCRGASLLLGSQKRLQINKKGRWPTSLHAEALWKQLLCVALVIGSPQGQCRRLPTLAYMPYISSHQHDLLFPTSS